MKPLFILVLISSLFIFPLTSDNLEDGWSAEGCTTILAAGNATRDGSIILAKNRDLSEYEVQWLYRAPRETHPPGTALKLQYIEIPQIPLTWSWVGSKSYTKKWGVGMGINEWGVAVADNDAPTREPLEGRGGLHDNDICRLILERSKTAQEGLRIAGGLIEKYGHSSIGQIYWIADSKECWILEGAGHHWAAVRVKDGVEVRANQFQITDHWDAGSDDLVEYAIEKGWCKSAEDFNFARCYSPKEYPYRSSQTRLERGLELLKKKVGDLTQEDLMEILADHYEGTIMYQKAHANPLFRTICSKRTVSAMVVNLRPNLPSEMQLMWYCMSSPCVSVFIPVYPNASIIPDPYTTGGGPEDISSYDENSAWWVFKKLQLLVDEDYETLHSKVRAMWDEIYADEVTQISQLESKLLNMFAEGKTREARELIDELVRERLMNAYYIAVKSVNELSGVEGINREDKTRGLPQTNLIVAVTLIVLWVTIYFMKIRRKYN